MKHWKMQEARYLWGTILLRSKIRIFLAIGREKKGLFKLVREGEGLTMPVDAPSLARKKRKVSRSLPEKSSTSLSTPKEEGKEKGLDLRGNLVFSFPIRRGRSSSLARNRSFLCE